MPTGVGLEYKVMSTMEGEYHGYGVPRHQHPFVNWHRTGKMHYVDIRVGHTFLIIISGLGKVVNRCPYPCPLGGWTTKTLNYT